MPGKPTTSDTTAEIVVIDRKPYDTSLDGYLTEVCLGRTMGEVMLSRETAMNAKQYTVACMVFNAVAELDVDLIRTIALRIDGTIPEENKRGGFANLIGLALEDVLSYEKAQQLQVCEDDPPIIAMAKALVYVATQPCGSNYAKRKERNLASQMILERTGGRKVEPTRIEGKVKYVEPDWLRFGSGQEEESEDDGNGL